MALVVAMLQFTVRTALCSVTHLGEVRLSLNTSTQTTGASREKTRVVLRPTELLCLKICRWAPESPIVRHTTGSCLLFRDQLQTPAAIEWKRLFEQSQVPLCWSQGGNMGHTWRQHEGHQAQYWSASWFIGWNPVGQLLKWHNLWLLRHLCKHSLSPSELCEVGWNFLTGFSTLLCSPGSRWLSFRVSLRWKNGCFLKLIAWTFWCLPFL